MKCYKCGAHPEVLRVPEMLVVEVECWCGAFRWAPIEHGDTDRAIMDLEVEATSLWNAAQEAYTADVQPL
ncbi:MAG: hypothetical protein JSR78_15235 [Proteobacteria bacterium]|nr:hypothetical protein [Pseudomonadota bacterium]